MNVANAASLGYPRKIFYLVIVIVKRYSLLVLVLKIVIYVCTRYLMQNLIARALREQETYALIACPTGQVRDFDII